MNASSVPRPDAATTSLPQRVSVLFDDLRELASDHLELAALEMQRAATGFARILVAAVVVSILVVSAWIAGVSGAIVAATNAGMSWTAALVVAALINLTAGGLIILWMRKQVGELLFAATLRQLRRGKSALKTEAEELSMAQGHRREEVRS